MRPERAVAFVLAVALGCAGGAASAAKAAKGAPELTSSGRANVMLAQNYLDGGHIPEAEERARAALLTDPASPLTHATLALVLVAQKQNDKAQAEFKRALAIAPGEGVVLNAYGSFLCARGDHAGADAAFQSALADKGYDSPGQAMVNAGSCAMLGQDWVKADGYLRRAVAIAPRNRQILLLLAEAQLKLGRPMEARAFVQRADDLGPDARTLALAAKTEDAAGDAVASARYRKRLQEQFPNYSPKAVGGPTQ
jgi:type IV pilus assembly protein PilF